MANTADFWTDHPLYTPPEFWLQGLRTSDYSKCMALLENKQELHKEVVRILSRRQVALVVCRALNIDAGGTLKEVQDRVTEHPVVIYLLMAARFAARKRRAAIADVVFGVLTEDARRECCYETESGDIGEPDRVAALIRLYMDDPQNLRFVRALHLWHSSSAASLVLDDHPMGLLPSLSFESFVLRDPAFHRALHGVSVRFEGMFPRGNGQWLIFVSHLYKEGTLVVDGVVTHGHHEELVVLDFQEGGRAVRISSKSKPPPVTIANAIAKAYFGRDCRYGPDLATSAPPSVQAFMAQVLNPDDHDLPLEYIEISDVPGLAGEPSMCLSRSSSRRMEEAVQGMESKIGDLTVRPERIARFDIRYDNARIGLYVRRKDGEHVVQFADGRTNNHRAERFQREMLETYGIAVRSARTPKA
ncbi:MAG: hypothetical protein H6738_25810 [Alphaproteobacteria bacterium]|nr:hypothetical protein [Alphaproteobacteria bacterium]